MLKEIIEPRRELVYFFLIAFLPLITLVLAWGGNTCTTVRQGFFSRDLRCVIAEPLLFVIFTLISSIIAYLFSGTLTYLLKRHIQSWCEKYRTAELIFRPTNLGLFYIVYITVAYSFYATIMFIIAGRNGLDLLLFGLTVFFLPTALLYISVLATYGLFVDITGVEIQFINSLPIPIQVVLSILLLVGSLALGITWFPLLARGFEKATLWSYRKLTLLSSYLNKDRETKNRVFFLLGLLFGAAVLSVSGAAYMNVNVPFGNHVTVKNTTETPSLPPGTDHSNQTITAYMENYHETKIRNGVIEGRPDWLNQMYRRGFNLKNTSVDCQPSVRSRTGTGNNTSVTVNQKCSWRFTLIDDWGSKERNYSFRDNGTYLVERVCRSYLTFDDLQRHTECSWNTQRKSGG